MPDATESCRGRAEIGRLKSWVSWLRPRSYWDVVVYHLPLAIISGIALFLPYVVTPEKLPLVPCTFHYLTGIPCPLCGFTRSFWSIATGEWWLALVNCPLSFAIYFFVAALFVWNATALIFRVVLFPGPMFQMLRAYRGKIAGIVCVLFFLNWVYRLAMGLT